ncbi:MAG: hypothetical protein ABSE73_00745 [Planctomycetota bacterium]
MPYDPQMLAAIQAAFAPAITPGLALGAASSDIFELYVFSLVIEAAESEGASISFSDFGGSLPTTFTSRTSPGEIWWTSQPYTHALITFPQKPPLEGHLSIYLSGKSRVLHEADISVIHQAEAVACRQNSSSPRSPKALLAIECKHYTSPLPLGLGRAFIGLRSDFSARYCYFVANTDSASISRLLSHNKHEKWEQGLVPVALNVVERLRNSFQDCFKNFKARP